MSDSKMLMRLKQINPDIEYPARLGKSWSTDEDKQLLEELALSETIENIAKNHKRSEGAIIARQKFFVRQYYKQNMQISEISQLVRLDENNINKILEKIDESDKNEKVLDNRNVSSQSNQTELSQIKDELIKLNQNFEKLIDILIQKKER